MKKTTALLAAVSASLIGFSGSVLSGDKELPRELSDYTLTGETRRCIRTVNISDSEPLDDRHIVFKLRNGDMYLNRLGGGCVGLRSNQTYQYRNRLAELCANEIISVVDTFTTGTLGSCGLNEFEKLEPRDPEASSGGA